MTPEAEAAAARQAALPITRVIRPHSIAIVGASDTPGAVGARVLENMDRFGFTGELHLVSRTRKEVKGRPCVSSIDDLPMGVDLAVLAVPQGGVKEAVEACVRRGVGGAVVYASGFAETGPEGAAEQAAIAAICRGGGLMMLGPNCIGLTNYIDGVPLSFGNQFPKQVTAPAVAVVGQSGGMVGAIRMALEDRQLGVGYTVSTGNEAVVGIDDFLDYLVLDPSTKVIAVFAEQIHHPRKFLALADEARRAGKAIVMVHTGRSEKGREAAQSHTGSVASDHAVMQTLLKARGVLMVDTVEDMVDVCELLMRFPAVPTGGMAMVTDSGAFKGMTADMCDDFGLELPGLQPQTIDALMAALPGFSSASNPVDVTAQGMNDFSLYGNCAEPLLADPTVGSLVIAIMPGTQASGLAVAKATLPKLAGSPKPIIYILFGAGPNVGQETIDLLRGAGVVYSRSPERMLSALAMVTRHGRGLARLQDQVPAAKRPSAQLPAQGMLPEYRAKAFLAAEGLPIPAGGLATTVAEAAAVAQRVGYPVALKAQSADLPHKSDVGGVALNVRDVGELQAAWARLNGDVAAARPDLHLDGVLVETMGGRGLEMIVSARRDPDWGPVLMVGLGGVWIEVLGDVKLLPIDLDEDAIVAEIQGLKAAKLLAGWRGAPAADVRAVARALKILGALMEANPELAEVEINPLVVYPDGVLVLDALAATTAPDDGENPR